MRALLFPELWWPPCALRIGGLWDEPSGALAQIHSRAHRLMLECGPLMLMSVVLKSGAPMTIYRARLVSLLLFVTLSIPGGTNLCGIPIAYHSGTAVQASCGVFAGYFRQRPSPIFLPKFGVFEQGRDGVNERMHMVSYIGLLAAK
ncbi:hypothetical protein B0H13DRAFT_2350362 [Mycena leptocephala]|nr:hypothetical protein B0H13DRAFT_2350362 [Mycena leptocephala]